MRRVARVSCCTDSGKAPETKTFTSSTSSSSRVRNRRAAKRFIRKLLKGQGILNNIELSHRRLLQCQDPALRDSGLQILDRLQVEVLVSADAPLDEIKAKIRPSSCCWKTGAARAVSKGLELTPRS